MMMRLALLILLVGNAGAPVPAEAQAIGLTAALDRPAAVYAIGDPISLTLTAARDCAVRVWLRDPVGKLDPVLPATADGEPLRLRSGERMRLPRNGGFRLTPPAGRYTFLITATTDSPGSRSLTDSDSRLAGRDAREQQQVSFMVEKI